MRSILLHNHRFQIISYGPAAFLLKTKDDEVNCPYLAEQLYHQNITGLEEVIAAERDIVLRIQPGKTMDVLKSIQQLKWQDSTQLQKEYRLPVNFDEGQDWLSVEAQTGLEREAIIAQLTAASLRLAMYGFMPGFLYLNGLPDHLHCSRKSSPRHRVPAGTVGIGGPYLGCYGLDSPGGWQLIGHCPLILFDRLKIPPMTIAVNDLLQIEAITPEKHQILQQASITFSEYNAADH